MIKNKFIQLKILQLIFLNFVKSQNILMFLLQYKDIVNLIVKSLNYNELLIIRVIKNLIQIKSNMKSTALKMFLVSKIYLKVKLMKNKNLM